MIYQFVHELNHVKESHRYDAELIPFPRSNSATFLNPETDYSRVAPQRLDFYGDLALLKHRDFPYIDKPMPLMSKRLLLTLLSVGEFPYKVFPTRIYDVSLKDQVEDRFYDDEVLQATENLEPHTDEFVIVQVTTWTNVLDYEGTIVADTSGTKPVPRRASELGSPSLNAEEIESLQLTVSEAELPGLFRIQGLGLLLCADKTKTACERAGITGVRFTPLPVPLGEGIRPYLDGYRLVAASDLP